MLKGIDLITAMNLTVMLIPAVVESPSGQLHFFEAGRAEGVSTAVLVIVSDWHLAALTTLQACEGDGGGEGMGEGCV